MRKRPYLVLSLVVLVSLLLVNIVHWTSKITELV